MSSPEQSLQHLTLSRSADPVLRRLFDRGILTIGKVGTGTAVALGPGFIFEYVINFAKDLSGNPIDGKVLSSNPTNDPSQSPNVNIYPKVTFTALAGSGAPYPIPSIPLVYARDTNASRCLGRSVVSPYSPTFYADPSFCDAEASIQVQFDPSMTIHHVAIDAFVESVPDSGLVYTPASAPYLTAFDLSGNAISRVTYAGTAQPCATQTLAINTNTQIGSIIFGGGYVPGNVFNSFFTNLRFSTSVNYS